MRKAGAMFIAAAAFIFFGFLVLQNVPNAQAGTFSQAYQNLKSNYPETIQQLKNADGSITDSDIESFVNDLSGSLQSKGELTGSNLESKFYEAAIDVMLDSEHEKVVNAALTGYSISWSDILNKRIPEGFESIKASLKAELLGGSGSAAGGGGGGLAVNGPKPQVPPGAAATVDPEAFEAALLQSVETGVVRIEMASSAKEVAFDRGQLEKVGADGKPIEVEIQGVQMKVPAGALEVAEVTADTFQVELGARKLSGGESPAVSSTYRVAGDVYEITAAAVQQDGKKTGITKFNAGITLSLPVPSAYSGSPSDLQVYRYDEESGQWVKVGGSYDAASGRIVFVTSHFSKYALMEVRPAGQPAQFQDVKGHWAEKDILAMAARGIIKGSDGRAMPDQEVTRAQFSTFLVLLLGIPGSGADLPFTDADRTAWYYDSLSRAYGAGLIRGYGGGLIGPDDYITREQMAVMVVGAAKYAGKTLPAAGSQVFADHGAIAPWASDPVYKAKAMGVITGLPNNIFGPGENATRAQALVMLSKLGL